MREGEEEGREGNDGAGEDGRGEGEVWEMKGESEEGGMMKEGVRELRVGTKSE